MTGRFIQETALPWLVLQLTHSPTQVGLLVFCRFMPFFVLGLFAGSLADRFDNRRLLIWTQAGQLATALALAILAFSTTVVWPFFVLATLGGIGTILDLPSRQAFTSRLVARTDLPNAIGLNASINSSARFVGPAVGGVLLAATGAGWCFIFNAISFLALLISLLLIRTRDLFPSDHDYTHRGTAAAIQEGLSYAWRSRQTRLLLTVVGLTSLAGFNPSVMFPILTDSTLHAGSAVYGLLLATFGLGAVVGALTVASIGRARWRGLLLGSLGFNLALLALAPVRNVALAAALLFIVGLFLTFWMAVAQSMLQLSTPGHLRGRVLSLFFFAAGGLVMFGALLAGCSYRRVGQSLRSASAH